MASGAAEDLDLGAQFPRQGPIICDGIAGVIAKSLQPKA